MDEASFIHWHGMIVPERVEALEDFARRRPGVEVALVSREFSVGGGMMRNFLAA